jgi:hypothetical protein
MISYATVIDNLEDINYHNEVKVILGLIKDRHNLLCAAEELIAHWDSPYWRNVQSTAYHINHLRAIVELTKEENDG